MVGRGGFEPPNPKGTDLQSAAVGLFAICPNGAFGRTRTCDLLINSQLLLPTELQKHGRDDRIRTYDLLAPNQALYQTKLHPDKLEWVMRIELTPGAWKALILPLNYTHERKPIELL